MTLTAAKKRRVEDALRRDYLATRLCIYADQVEAPYRTPDTVDKQAAALMREAADVIVGKRKG